MADFVSIDDKPAIRFIGVYSGRLQTKDANEVQLGMVWPPEDIQEIIDGHKWDK